MLMDCLMLLGMLMKVALKHHTYNEIKQYIRHVLEIDLGSNFNDFLEVQATKSCKIMGQRRSTKKGLKIDK